jgi:hypothetical protein
VIPDAGDRSSDELIADVDRMMYVAKGRRDCVVVEGAK